MKRSSCYRFWSSCLLALLFSSHSQAARQFDTSSLNEFALNIERHKSDVDFSATTERTTLNLLGIDWFEYFNPSFHGGLELGYLELDQPNNPVSSARLTDGQFVGLILRFIPLRTQLLDVQIDLGYRYSQTENLLTSQQTEFVWHQGRVSAQLNLQLGESVSLAVAHEYAKLDGEQQDNGTISQIRSFEAQHSNQRLGVDIEVDRTGHIGLEWLGGDREGGRFYFRRRF